MNGKNNKIKIAAIADLHTGHNSSGIFSDVFSKISENADILLLCGDLTEQGDPVEAEILSRELNSLQIPVIGILGNHDYDKGKQKEIIDILSQKKVEILDGTTSIFRNIGFAGIKGFCGGFKNHMLQAWGETIIKDFVHEAVNEVLKLENALSQLETEKKIVLIHYSPITETIEGEPKELYTLLGSSRFLEPVNSYNVSAVFHGHAHIGVPKFKTPAGTIVCNVAFPLLKKLYPDHPYQIIEI